MVDILKYVLILLVLGAVSFDIFSVRKKKALSEQRMEAEKRELTVKMGDLEKDLAKLKDEKERHEANAKKMIADAEKLAREMETRAKDVQNEYEKKLSDQNDAFEQKIADLKVGHEKQLDEAKQSTKQHSARQKSGETQERTERKPERKEIKCPRCSGLGEIKVKETCARCGGSGRVTTLRTTYKHSDSFHVGHYVDREYVSDCPSCKTKGLRGSGGCGYVTRIQQCPRCNGAGVIEKR